MPTCPFLERGGLFAIVLREPPSQESNTAFTVPAACLFIALSASGVPASVFLLKDRLDIEVRAFGA
jgi:hypothetical protein